MTSLNWSKTRFRKLNIFLVLILITLVFSLWYFPLPESVSSRIEIAPKTASIVGSLAVSFFWVMWLSSNYVRQKTGMKPLEYEEFLDAGTFVAGAYGAFLGMRVALAAMSSQSSLVENIAVLVGGGLGFLTFWGLASILIGQTKLWKWSISEL